MFDTTTLKNNAFVIEKIFHIPIEDHTQADNEIIGFDIIGETPEELLTHIVYATYGKYAGDISLLDALIQERAMDLERENQKITAFNE